MRIKWIAVLGFSLALLTGCASLSGIGIAPPVFSVASDRSPELRLVGPSLQRPLGGATMRLYARVENPNPIGITLSALTGTLQLEGYDAADADFPLGLPLAARQVTVVPLEISISFANLAGLAEILARSVTTGEIGYSLRGTARVDAGVLGQPLFGPMTILEGRVQAWR